MAFSAMVYGWKMSENETRMATQLAEIEQQASRATDRALKAEERCRALETQVHDLLGDVAGEWTPEAHAAAAIPHLFGDRTDEFDERKAAAIERQDRALKAERTLTSMEPERVSALERVADTERAHIRLALDDLDRGDEQSAGMVLRAALQLAHAPAPDTDTPTCCG